jgi:hypothetical protein
LKVLGANFPQKGVWGQLIQQCEEAPEEGDLEYKGASTEAPLFRGRGEKRVSCLLNH